VPPSDQLPERRGKRSSEFETAGEGLAAFGEWHRRAAAPFAGVSYRGVSAALTVGRNISATFTNQWEEGMPGSPADVGRNHWLFFVSASESIGEARHPLAGPSGFESLPPSQNVAIAPPGICASRRTGERLGRMWPRSLA